MKKLHFSVLFSFASALLLSTGCASHFPARVLHSVAMTNGAEEVYEFQLEYGKITLPFETGPDREFGAGGERLIAYEMVVPSNAIVRWKIADGTSYCPKVEVRKFLPEPDKFHGVVEFSISHNKLLVVAFDHPLDRGSRVRPRSIYEGAPAKCQN
jgi:hypothetical protein